MSFFGNSIPKIICLSKYLCKWNVFLTSALGFQMDHNFIHNVLQNLGSLQFQSTQKKLHLKHFSIVKPLFYLELRVKKLTLPGKCAQTGQSSRKSDFWALLERIGLFCCFWRLKTILNWWYLSKTRSNDFNEILDHLTSRKFTPDLKNMSFVHSLLKIQWISSKIKFVW